MGVAGVHLRALTIPSFMGNMLRQVQSISNDGVIRGMVPDDMAAILADVLGSGRLRPVPRR